MSKFDKLIEEATGTIEEGSKFTHDFGSFKPSTVKKSKKFRPIVKDALEDFWITVAKKFPEIETGDMGPEDVIKMEDFMTQMLTRWYDDNSTEG